jgi:WD40 repeat protein
MTAVARAVHYAHQRGLLHRDLKPGNILIDNDGIPHVTDFGLAKRMTTEGGVTQTGAIVGTPEYMAPEQAAGRKDLSTAADVYSLGAILYTLLTGQPPFRGETILETLKHVAEKEPTSPQSLNAKIDRDLATICLKCLEKDPSRRYPSAQAFADDLDRWLRGEPILARPTTTVERTVKWVRRRPMVAGLIAAMVLVTLIGFGGISWSLVWALDERDHAVSQEEKAKNLAADNKKLAENEGDARKLADERREQAEALALRIQFDHYFAKAQDRPDLALVGMASLLPKAAILKDWRLADSLRLHIAAVGENAARLKTMVAANEVAVALSADGKMALSPNGFHTAQLWDTATGKPIGQPLQHQETVLGIVLMAVALSADGKTALTADFDAQAWETATGKPIGPPLQHFQVVKDPKDNKKDFKVRRFIRDVALSADGKIALTVSEDSVARLWETATGKPIGSQIENEYKAIALSADGKTALIAGRLWDTASAKPVEPPLPFKEGLRPVALSGDAKTLLTWSNDNTARLWDTASGTPIGPPVQHQAGLTAAALSANGKTALTATKDNVARLWDTATGKLLGPPLQHQSEVGAVALSADGKTALTGSRDGAARLWEPPANKPIGPALLLKQEGLFAVALSADGKTALTSSAGYVKKNLLLAEVRLWETASGKPMGAPLLQQQQDIVPAVALSADGRTALTGNRDKTAQVWDTATGKRIGLPLHHRMEVHAVALSADGKIALTATPELAALLWDTATGKPIGKPLEYFGEPNSAHGSVVGVALSADGKTALTADAGGTVQLWDTASGKPLGPRLQDQIRGRVVALSGDGKIALSGAWGKTARLWDTASGKPIGPPMQHQDEVGALAISADGKIALTGSKDQTARLWETATGKPIGPPLQHKGEVGAVALSADGKTALTGSWEKAGPEPWKTIASAKLWQVPQPVRGEPERIMLWAQVITGLEVDDLTAVRFLDAKTWQERRHRLANLGGSPLRE